MYGYRLTLEPDDNNTLLVTCPAFPEVATFGPQGPEGRQELLRIATNAILEAVAGRMARGEEVPDPDRAVDDDPTGGVTPIASLTLNEQVKVELYEAMRLRKWKRADLQRALGWPRNQVDRLFDLDHNSKTDQLEKAAEALGFQVHAGFVPLLRLQAEAVSAG